MAVSRRRPYGVHRRRILLRENLQAAKRSRTQLSKIEGPPVVGAADLMKEVDVDTDDVSTAAPASPVPSNSASSSSHLPVDDRSSSPEQATVNVQTMVDEPEQLTDNAQKMVDEPVQVTDQAHTLQSSDEQVAKKKLREQVLMLPSVFEGRPPVLLFSYTEACGAKQRNMSRAVDLGVDAPKVSFIHTNRVGEYNAVINTMRQGGLRRAEEDKQKWSVLWSRHPPAETMCSMTSLQKTNHYPGSQHLGDKGLLWKCIASMQERFDDYSITPIGYQLPEAGVSFAAARRREPDALWIWKPLTGSCGRGIKVFSSQDESNEQRKLMAKAAIVQRYVPSPLLINGYKFDMRIYVVVISYEPLKVYIATEGLCRLATQKYTEDPSTLGDRTRHLTNYSVNKKSALFVKNTDTADADNSQSSKWSLTELRAHFESIGLDYDLMWDGIKDNVVKTLLAVEPQMRAEWTKSLNSEGAGWLASGPGGAHAASCFELYGFDILVDTQMKSWLLEVNIYPSLSSGSPLDKRIKTKLVADMLTLVGLQAPVPTEDRAVKRARKSHSVISADDSSAKISLQNASASDLAKKAAHLANCKTPLDAVNSFDEMAWDLVLEAHDEDMRSGGLERIYPTSESAKYVPFMAEEAYSNVVLRRFYEAGGADQFWGSKATLSQSLPVYVPQKTCFQKS